MTYCFKERCKLAAGLPSDIKKCREYRMGKLILLKRRRTRYRQKAMEARLSGDTERLLEIRRHLYRTLSQIYDLEKKLLLGVQANAEIDGQNEQDEHDDVFDHPGNIVSLEELREYELRDECIGFDDDDDDEEEA